MRIVLKIGTSSLTSKDGANFSLIEEVVKLIVELRKQKHSVVLVSSGAVGLGSRRLNWSEKPRKVTAKQAAASVGQILLAETYKRFFEIHGQQVIGQVLLTRTSMQDREGYLNARLTFRELLKLGVVPIVNENDVVADEEIRFSDNDQLAALVSEMIEAEHLFILTDTEGLFTEDPRVNPEAKLIEKVDEVTEEIEELSKGKGSKWGTGGMFSKVNAAKMATSRGTTVHIVSAKDPCKILDILSGKAKHGTTFKAKRNPIDAKRAWIAYAVSSVGKLIVDDGAREAVLNNKSLLPVGIKVVCGNFGRGQPVEIIYSNSSSSSNSDTGIVIAKGISRYSSDDLNKIKGHPSEKIEEILGYTYGKSALHRDDIVILDTNKIKK